MPGYEIVERDREMQMKFGRALLSAVGSPDRKGRVQVTLQLCEHGHPTSGEAEVCPAGGRFVFRYADGDRPGLMLVEDGLAGRQTDEVWPPDRPDAASV